MGLAAGSGRAGHAAALRAAQRSRAQRRQVRLRPGAVRRLHRARRRQGGALLRDAGQRRSRAREVTTLEGLGTPDKPHRAAAGVHRRAGRAVRLLHQRHDHGGEGAARPQSAARPRTRSAQALAGNLCRCGTHNRIVRAVLRAAQASREAMTMNAPRAAAREFTAGSAARHRLPLDADVALGQQRARLPASLQGNRKLDAWVASTPTAPPRSSTGKVELGQGMLTALAPDRRRGARSAARARDA